MKRFFLITWLLVGLLSASCAVPRFAVNTEVDGQLVDTTVDSEIAQYYLQQYIHGERTRPEFDSAIEAIKQRLASGELTSEYLLEVSEAHSTDFGALMLWQQLRNDSVNERAIQVFADEFAKVSSSPLSAIDASAHDGADYLFVFAPGWLYRRHPSVGGDFADQRRTLLEAGYRTRLLACDENGTIEANAAIITEELGYILEREENVVLISVSKAGPEVALALTQLKSSPHADKLKAWINIGGVLRGSPLADDAFKWPTRWGVKLFLMRCDPMDSIHSMKPEVLGPVADLFSPPSNTLILNYVGVPMTGDLTKFGWPGYLRMRHLGPNDGATMILDEIPPNSFSVPELGLDHYFRHPQINLKSLALARTVIRLLAK